ncbi:hypothetical protein [Rhizosaccharibacter radicis]|uniref:Uncharacterized protein n=1 Tax=Rhizosaccharibacter radicis TaxID=2782605 RepID=A0ABT1VV70_9PROT|nr:hypothetical protein [Acetobacteraceae bacterium KSS12]
MRLDQCRHGGGSSLTDGEPDFVGSETPRQRRRLPERILVAVHQACDLRDFVVAHGLLDVAEGLLARPPLPGMEAIHRRNLDGFLAAHQRLWQLERV